MRPTNSIKRARRVVCVRIWTAACRDTNSLKRQNPVDRLFSVPFNHVSSTIKWNPNQIRMVKGAYVYIEFLRGSFAEKYPYRGAGYSETPCMRIGTYV